jgi:hypothetical protein
VRGFWHGGCCTRRWCRRFCLWDESLVPAKHHAEEFVGAVKPLLVPLATTCLLGLSGCTNGGGVHAGPFTGTWHVHTYSLTIKADGTGTAMWPTHVGCGSGPGEGPPPCDSVVPGTLAGGTHVDYIIDGGHAQIILTSVKGDTARGRIENSTVQSTLPDGPVTFRVSSKDLLYVTPSKPTTSSPFGATPLCGPRAEALSISQQQAEGINCGA